MYEPAASPVWHVEGAHTFFAGPLRYNAPHQHGAPVYLAGLYGRFRIRIRGEAWSTCRTALVPAGVLHELDLAGDPIAVLYLEPAAAPADALAPLLRGAEASGGALLADGGEIVALRTIWEAADAAVWMGEALADLTAFSGRRSRLGLDGRIARVIESLARRPEPARSAEALAREVGLSSSRLQHLFTQEVGVPFRRYRAWLRMRRAIAVAATGATFTQAAHAAGFADQAHFAHDFRKTFGAPASGSLLNVRR